MREVWFVQREAKREEGSVPSKCNNCHVSNQLAKSVPWQLHVPRRLVQWKGKKNQCLYQQNAAETERTGGKYLAHKAASKCSLVCITSYAATEAYWHICKQKQTNKKLQSLQFSSHIQPTWIVCKRQSTWVHLALWAHTVFVWNSCVHHLQIFIDSLLFRLVNICCFHSLPCVLIWIKQLACDYCLVCFVTPVFHYQHFLQSLWRKNNDNSNSMVCQQSHTELFAVDTQKPMHG